MCCDPLEVCEGTAGGLWELTDWINKLHLFLLPFDITYTKFSFKMETKPYGVLITLMLFIRTEMQKYNRRSDSFQGGSRVHVLCRLLRNNSFPILYFKNMKRKRTQKWSVSSTAVSPHGIPLYLLAVKSEYSSKDKLRTSELWDRLMNGRSLEIRPPFRSIKAQHPRCYNLKGEN